MRTENWKKIVTGCGMVLLAAYVGGFFEILFSRSEVCLSPLQCLYAGCGTSSGRKWSMAAVVLLLALTVLVIWRGKDNPLHDERNFEISDQGTYGTAGFMGTQEQKEILQADRGMEHIKGIIFGRELSNGNILSLPVDSRLNRNIAVCGSQGSMKSRAFARVMALQCVRRGESMYITDPKSELYEDLCAYLKEEGYVVKQLNLIQLTHSDA